MAEIKLTTLEVIEDAIKVGDKRRALDIIHNAKEILRAGVRAQASAKTGLRNELNGVQLAIEQSNSLIHVCKLAQAAQSRDVDAVVVVLNDVQGKLENARKRIHKAIDLIAEVANG